MELSWNNDIALKLSHEVQSHDVFDYLIEQCGDIDKMIIGSFAMNDAYIRRIIRSREKVKEIEVFLDLTIADRHTSNSIYISQNVDALYLTNNHSKFIYCKGDQEILALMSNNATNNYRYEFQVFIRDRGTIVDFLQQYEVMKKESLLYEFDR